MMWHNRWASATAIFNVISFAERPLAVRMDASFIQYIALVISGRHNCLMMKHTVKKIEVLVYLGMCNSQNLV